MSKGTQRVDRRRLIRKSAAATAGASLASTALPGVQFAKPATAVTAAERRDLPARAAPPALQVDLRAAVEQILAMPGAGDVPGVVVYIDSPSLQVFEAAGVADLEANTPIDRDMRFQIGSNTKMMTAALVLQLHEEGALSIDDTPETHLPDIATRVPGWNVITVRMLLQHTSGLFDYIEDVAYGGLATWHQTGSLSGLEQSWTPAEIIDYVATYRASNYSFPPGEEGKWAYTNTGYILLGMIVEHVTGTSFADNVRQRIFDPLGMTDSVVAEGIPDMGALHGYFQRPWELDATSWNLSQGWAAGAVLSTPTDMAVFMRGLLGGALFNDPATLQLMQAGMYVPARGTNYGLGLTGISPTIWGHSGQTLGFQSHVVHQPATDTVMIAWTNTAEVANMAFTFFPFSLPEPPEGTPPAATPAG